jgi:hypothetical protein
MLDIATILNLVVTTFTNFGQLAGMAALISSVVNVLKVFNVIKDGDSGKVFAGLDLVAILGLVAVQLFAPSVGVNVINVDAGLLAAVVLLVLGYLGSMGVGKLTQVAFKSMGVFKSFSKKA